MSQADGFEGLGAVHPKKLTEARLQLHYAAQPVSGVGRSFLPKENDDSHTNLSWNSDGGSLRGRTVGGEAEVCAELSFAPFELRVLTGGAVAATLALAGSTMAAADQWIAAQVASLTDDIEPQPLTPLHYDMPENELGNGAVFKGSLDGEREELRNWYDAAAVVLQRVRDHEADTSEIACWPHHFDIATLIELGGGKTVGVGLSPGDESYGQPYYYVGPYPRPKPEDLKPLDSVGRWHTDGSVFAVLTGEEIVDSEDQRAVVEDFVEAAVSASKQLLEAM